MPQPVRGEPCEFRGGWEQAYGTIDGAPVALTGRFLKANAFVGADALGQPLVSFELRGHGPRLFEQITTRLLNQELGIFLDDELLSSPTVNAVIGDRGVITGVPFERARELVVQLNSGALPLALTVLQEQTVDATLGEDSVRRSVLAGEIGFLLVVLFMLLYYRLPGLLASGALITYALLTMAVFKLIPVTLTLAGIGAFVLSVGMAVDANILIFERMKEELRAGRAYATAVDSGFTRAWPSIRDSNVATLITCRDPLRARRRHRGARARRLRRAARTGLRGHAGGGRARLDVLRHHCHTLAASADRRHATGPAVRLAHRRRAPGVR